MKFLFSLLLVSIYFTSSGITQNSSNPTTDQLYQNYLQYKETSLETRRFKQDDILPLIHKFQSEPQFNVRQVGSSIEGRPLYLISIGTGSTDILYWSQMHGDESTATGALFDVLNFLLEPGEEMNDLRDEMLKNVTLHFMPMLNPDGAETFRRRNAIDIDINRDALRLTSPESAALKQVRDSLNALFGFNLHDQSTLYTAGRAENPATISFLAPAYDYEQSENQVRRNAMKLIVYLDSILQTFIPGQVAKYSDEHEPRAFGDMMQQWGTSTILIESGGYPGDPEKQHIRRVNFILLLAAADAIGKENFQDESVEDYFKIPENNSFLEDLIVRNIQIENEDQFFEIDLAIRYGERAIDNYRSFRYHGRINDLGDLSIYHGYQEVKGNGLIARPGRVYGERLEGMDELKAIDISELLKEGYTDLAINLGAISAADDKFLQSYPLNLHLNHPRENRIGLGSIPNLVLMDENQQVHYVIVNGFVYEPEKDNVESLKNGVIHR